MDVKLGLRAQGTEEEYGHKTKESKRKTRKNYTNCISYQVVFEGRAWVT